MQVINLLTFEGRIKGVLCLDKKEMEEPSYVLIWCENVILATGGPAGMYHDSVYPVSQTGSTGMAFEAGAVGKNLTEWQFGMASLNPRWNVSGTYMQVLPAFISTDQEGKDDYRITPGKLGEKEELPYGALIPEARDYLKQAGACFGTPIERLKHMNEPAIHFYQDHHVDLYKERLEIAV